MTNKINGNLKAEEIVQRARARNNFKGEIIAKSKQQKPCFSGVIKNLRRINIEYNPSYPLHQVPFNDAFDSALEAVVNHEIIHKGDGNGRGCPKSEKYDLNNILLPISTTLKSKGFPNVPIGDQGHTLYTYFANLFEDFIDNNIISENNPKGIFLVYDDMAQHDKNISDLFEGFIKLQAMSFPKKEGVSLMLNHFKQSEKAKSAVKNYLARTKILEIPREQRTDFLSNPENWNELSKIFAEEFSKLIDLSDLNKSYFCLFGGNDFSRLNDEEVQMEIAIEAYGKRGNKFEPPSFMDENLALLSLYKQLAKKIEMKVNSYSVETKRPVSHVSRRKFDFEKDNIERIVFGINDKGKIEAQIGNYPLEVISRYQISAGSFPEVRVGLLDCSSSTQISINREQGKIMNPWAEEKRQWTDTSIYHHELLCFFGLCELFRRRGTLKDSNVKLGVFSNETRMAKDLRESEKLVLQPSFGGTQFNKQAIEEIFKGKGSLVYTISDGEIYNWNSVKNIFIEKAKEHNFFHLQIGGESQMYKDLKAAGLKAIIDDGTNSAKLLIDLTQQSVYGVK